MRFTAADCGSGKTVNIIIASIALLSYDGEEKIVILTTNEFVQARLEEDLKKYKADIKVR